MSDIASDIALEFRGSETSPDGSIVNHLAIIWEPKKETGTQDWSCTVGVYSLVPDAERIIGKTAAQALRLAKLFVMDLLERHGATIEAADREL
jgi:hypothetical protein